MNAELIFHSGVSTDTNSGSTTTFTPFSIAINSNVGPQGPQGPQGPPGPKGEDGGIAELLQAAFNDGKLIGMQNGELIAIDPTELPKKTVNHNQLSASDSWSIEHNFNYYPTVTVVDSGGNVVVGDVQYVDMHHIHISFKSPFTGKAILN